MDSLKQKTGENLSSLTINNFCLNPDRSTCSTLISEGLETTNFPVLNKDYESKVSNEVEFVTLSRKKICEKCIWAKK
jgi:hypothetical protein